MYQKNHTQLDIQHQYENILLGPHPTEQIKNKTFSLIKPKMFYLVHLLINPKSQIFKSIKEIQHPLGKSQTHTFVTFVDMSLIDQVGYKNIKNPNTALKAFQRKNYMDVKNVE